jgi:hypothetical protein
MADGDRGDPGDIRDARGRFAPGNRGGPGPKPYGQTITPILAKIAHELSADGKRTNAEALADKLWELAKAGERWAAEYVTNRLDGKPRETVVTEGENRAPIILLRMPDVAGEGKAEA